MNTNHRIHVWYDLPTFGGFFYGIHVGKYISPMDGMGTIEVTETLVDEYLKKIIQPLGFLDRGHGKGCCWKQLLGCPWKVVTS